MIDMQPDFYSEFMALDTSKIPVKEWRPHEDDEHYQFDCGRTMNISASKSIVVLSKMSVMVVVVN